MNSSRAFRFSIAVLIPLTVGWKVLAHSAAPDDLLDRISSFLARNDFVVEEPEKILNVGPSASEGAIINASHGACKISMAQIGVDGATRALVDSRLAGADRHFIVFQGKTYSARPDFAILASYFWTVLLKDMGISHRGLPVVAVAANAACNAEALPWREL